MLTTTNNADTNTAKYIWHRAILKLLATTLAVEHWTKHRHLNLFQTTTAVVLQHC